MATYQILLRSHHHHYIKFDSAQIKRHYLFSYHIFFHFATAHASFPQLLYDIKFPLTISINLLANITLFSTLPILCKFSSTSLFFILLSHFVLFHLHLTLPLKNGHFLSFLRSFVAPLHKISLTFFLIPSLSPSFHLPFFLQQFFMSPTFLQGVVSNLPALPSPALHQVRHCTNKTSLLVLLSHFFLFTAPHVSFPRLLYVINFP